MIKLSLDLQIEKYEKILSDNPDDLSALMAYGEANLRRGRKLSALSAYQRILRTKPEVLEAHLALARIFFLQKLYELAFNELKKSFELDPSSVEGRLLYKEMTSQLETPKDIKEEFQQFINQELKNKDIAVYSRQLEIEQGKLEKDVVEMERLLAAGPDIILEYHRNMALKRRDVILNLAELLQKLTKKTEVLEAVEELPVAEIVTEKLPPLDKPSLSASSISREQARSQENLGNIALVLEPIYKTRGVIALYLTNQSGDIVYSEGDNSLASSISSLVSTVVNLTKIAGKNLNYWVAEYEQGLTVLLQINSSNLLIILGDKGVNFGALRIALDKGRKTLASVLES